MAQKIIDIGAQANDGSGDTIRNAGRKINENFTELYAYPVVSADIKFEQNNIVSKSSNADIVLKPSGTGNVVFPGLTIEDNNIKLTRSNDDLKIIPSGSGRVVVDGVGFSGTSINSADSSTININENLRIEGALTGAGTTTFDSGVQLDLTTLDVTGETTVANLTVSGPSSFAGTTTIDNLTFNDNIIGTSSNADLLLTPGGTGVVNVSNLTIDSSVNLTDNVIKVTRSDDNLVLSPSGSGSVEIISGLTTAAVTTTGNVDITGTKTVTGQMDVEGLTIKDNTISTNASNANLEISGNGSGNVVIDDVDIGGGAIDNVVIGGTTPAAGTFTSIAFTDSTITADGVTITDNVITSNRSNDNLEFKANGSGYVNINGNLITGGINLPNSDGNNGQLLQTNGSGQLSWVTSPILLGVSDIQDARNTIGFSTLTDIDANTAVGAHETIGSGSDSVLDEFDQTKYDSAWYLCLQRYDAADSSIEYAGFKTTIAQGTTDGSTFDAFDGTSQIIKTNNDDEILVTSSDIRSAVGKVRFKGQAGTLADGSTKSTFNALSFYRIGLGDNDSSGYSDGNVATKVTADLDSAVATLDSFAHASFRGAKYYVSVNNTTTNEVMNAEVIVVHNGSDAFIQTYNQLSSNSGNTSLATFTADISGSDVRLRGANGTAGTCRVTLYRVLLSDSESDSTINSNEKIIGAQTVSNTASTTINTDSYRGSASPDMSSQKVIKSVAKTDFDSVFYHMVQKDMTNNEFIMNKLSVNHGISADGSTEVAGITDSHIVKSGAMNDITAFDVGLNGSNLELKATGQNDGSTTIANSLQYYAIGLGPNTTTGTTGKIGTHAGVTAGGNNETVIDHVIAEGTTQTSTDAERTGAEFTASQFNGALYHVVTKDVANGSFETQKISVLHNFNDAFLTSSAVTRTDAGDTHPTFDADMVTADDSASKIRLRMTDSDGSSVTPSNTMAYYRIGIGDDDSTSYIGELGQVHDITLTPIIGSATATLDSFAHGSHNGAKYFINVKNQSTGECSNIEALVTHDGTDAYITTYNEHFSGNNSLISLSAVISGSDLILRGSATAGDSTKVIVNRVVLFSDSESDEETTDSTRKLIGNTIVSSSATEFDSFETQHTDAAHYVITGQKGSTENFICEATVVTDGTNVFVSQGPNVSSKSTDMLEITATISGGIVSVKASSTSGSSTVQAYAVKLKAPTDNATTLDSWAHADYRGAKYYISADDTINGHISNIECLVVHDGSNAYISSFNENNSHNSLITLTADISGTNLRLLATPSSADIKIKFYRIRLSDSESNAEGADSKLCDTVTVSSSATAIDTFFDTSQTGAHYVIVARNASEGTAEITEATVLTNGAQAFVAQANFVSSKSTPMLSFTAAHDGSNTVTLNAASTAGGSTTVNAFRIHMKVSDAFAYDVIDTFEHASIQLANYVVVGKNASNESQIAELMVTTDSTAPYLLQEGPNISTHSTTTPLMNFTVAHNGSNVELRAQNSQENTDTTVNMFRINLTRAAGSPSSIATLDTFDKTEYRSAKYNVSISDAGSGALGLYETLDVNVVHDGTTVYLSTFGRVTNHTSDLVTFSADISGDDVRLRGTISNTNTHTVTVVRRVMEV